MLVTAMRPLSKVEDEGFKRTISIPNPEDVDMLTFLYSNSKFHFLKSDVWTMPVFLFFCILPLYQNSNICCLFIIYNFDISTNSTV